MKINSIEIEWKKKKIILLKWPVRRIEKKDANRHTIHNTGWIFILTNIKESLNWTNSAGVCKLTFEYSFPYNTLFEKRVFLTEKLRFQ